MPSEIIHYVDPDADAGGNGTEFTLTGSTCAYQSLNAWESAQQRDLTSADEIEHVYCSSNLDAGSGSADTSIGVAISGWTADSTRYIIVEGYSNHLGKWNNNYYRIDNTDAIVIDNYITNTRIIGIQAKIIISAAATEGWSCFVVASTGDSGGTFYFYRCLFLADTSGDDGSYRSSAITAVGSGAATVYAINCLAYNFVSNPSATAGRAFHLLTNASITMYCYNCTVVDSYDAYYRNNGTFYARNCGAAACTGGFVGTITQTTCSTTTPTFVNYGGDDFHLAPSDTTWTNQGTDYSSSGLYYDDIDKHIRGLWSIGVDDGPVLARSFAAGTSI